MLLREYLLKHWPQLRNISFRFPENGVACSRLIFTHNGWNFYIKSPVVRLIFVVLSELVLLEEYINKYRHLKLRGLFFVFLSLNILRADGGNSGGTEGGLFRKYCPGIIVE